MLAAQQSACTYATELYLKVVKMINFVLCIFTIIFFKKAFGLNFIPWACGAGTDLSGYQGNTSPPTPHITVEETEALRHGVIPWRLRSHDVAVPHHDGLLSVALHLTPKGQLQLATLPLTLLPPVPPPSYHTSPAKPPGCSCEIKVQMSISPD